MIRQILSVILGIFILRMGVHWASDSPLERYSFSKLILARDGELLRFTLSGDEKYRLRTRIKDINSKYIEAVLLKEDQYFHIHPGVNPVALMRALNSMNTVKPVGGSTITMQLVRLHEGVHTRTIWGKSRQIAKALWYEFIYDKATILEAYLNLIPFGSNVEGIEAAAQIFFHKSNKALTLNELLMLVLVPQSPEARRPDTAQYADFAKNYSNLLEVWLKSHAQDRGLRNLVVIPPRTFAVRDLPFRAPHFSEWIVRQGDQSSIVSTSLNFSIQSSVESKLRNYIREKQVYGVKNAAAIVLNYQTSEIVSWVGSNNFHDETIDGQVDGVLALRSPGSTLKPFIYALAIDEGIIHPLSLLKDSPINLGPYDPENFDKHFMGPISATKALTESRNIPAVSLALGLKKQNLFGLLKAAGIYFPRSEDYYGMAVNLGGAEMSLLDLAKLYANLARLGRVENLTYRRLASDNGGNVRVPSGMESRILSEEASYSILKMLEQNPRSRFGRLEKLSRDSLAISWKTGTSWGYRDAWTLGIIGPYVVGVWLGNFDNEANNILIGRAMAAPLFFDLVGSLPTSNLLGSPPWDQYRRLNLTTVSVCPLSGGIRNDYCPHSVKATFIPGISPIHKCQIHRQILVSKSTGQRLCNLHGMDFEARVVEVWPTDLLNLFAKAGLPKGSLPEFEPKCELTKSQSQGIDPDIISPKRELVYTLNSRKILENSSIPFQAYADGDVKKLFWFANHQFIGDSIPNETLFRRLPRGRYKILVVDDQGRSSGLRMRVEIN
jgi:penicillin-binding protein 1C